MEHAERLERLRGQCEAAGVSGVIVPITNAFQGEYIPAADQRLTWLTGFTGSNGLAIVLAEKAAFFTDGRYTIQVEAEVDGALYERYNMAEEKPHEWLKQHAAEGAIIAYDPWLHTKKQLKQYKGAAEDTGFALRPCENMIDPLWKDRPAAPDAVVRSHPESYAGTDAATKRAQIAEALKAKRADALVLSAGDSICWLLNVRGGDIPHTPFMLAYAILYADARAALFFDPSRVDEHCRAHLGADVDVKPISALGEALGELTGKRVMLDPGNVSSWFFDRLEEAGATCVEGEDPCMLPKATKNEVELRGATAAHIRDGVAVTKFLHWFSQEAPKGDLTELSAAAKLEAFRREQPLYQENSFETISGYGPNGAIIHYRVTEESNVPIGTEQLYLVDSGGQYLDGTTDITRTLAVGSPTAEQKRHFTLVLKGMIGLTQVHFPKGTKGGQLDVLARHALWQAGLDYGHGTGHGIGSYLSVHEGPQGISHRSMGTALAPGMLLSNEPGYYLEGAYGIRIENVIAVVEKAKAADSDKPFYGFDTLTLAPIDRQLIQPELLTKAERHWLNTYHERVRDELTSHLLEDAALVTWLAEVTQPI